MKHPALLMICFVILFAKGENGNEMTEEKFSRLENELMNVVSRVQSIENEKNELKSQMTNLENENYELRLKMKNLNLLGRENQILFTPGHG